VYTRVESIAVITLLTVSALVMMVPQSANAESGSFTIYPGETRFASFGTAPVNDLLLWSLTVDTWSTVFSVWLQAPDTTHLSIVSYTWGKIVDMAGEWKLGFSIESSGVWSATVTYSVYSIHPTIEIASPLNGAFVNTTTILVSGTVDGWADSVGVSTDEVHYDSADLYMGTWNRQVTLGADGMYHLYAEETINWGSYWVKYYDSVTLMLDRVPPELQITKPAVESYIAGTVDMTWQCSDSNGVAKREVKVGATDWVTVTTNTYTTQVEEGYHWVAVRITDVAGNTAFAEVRVFSDTVAPEVWIQQPEMNAKISKDHVDVTWIGGDEQSGLDHYEVQINGGQWIDVGYATSYEFTNLDDVWYSVNVKVVDKSGNTATSTVGFGIYTSIWSQNGPYHGIPLYALIAAAILGAILSALVYWRKRGATAKRPPEEPPQETQ